MKSINKNTPPQIFQDYANTHNRNRTGAQIWKSFKNNEQRRIALHDSLLKEQGYLCAYCGKKIGKEPNDTFSVEHFEDKGNHPILTLEYTNLLGCCKDSQPQEVQLSDIQCRPKTFTNIANELNIDIEQFNGRMRNGIKILDDEDLESLGETKIQYNRGIAQHCDDGKEHRLRTIGWQEQTEKVEQYVINPANEIDCDTFFDYQMDDTNIYCDIIAVENLPQTERAKNTIKVFELNPTDNNVNNLRKLRTDAVNAAKIILRKSQTFEMDIADIIADIYDGDNGKLSPFCFVTVYELRKKL